MTGLVIKIRCVYCAVRPQFFKNILPVSFNFQRVNCANYSHTDNQLRIVTYLSISEFRKFDVRGSVHHSTIHREKPNKMQECIKIFIIPYLYEAQHVSGETPPIIRSLKLHWQPLVFHTWKAVGCVVGGRCLAQCV